MKCICENLHNINQSEYVGVDEEGTITFMVVGLKQFIPFVVQAIPEVIFNRHWLVEKISDNIDNLIEFGLCVRIYKLLSIIQLM